jgi:site-specific DNA-methyltransferase (adenine-specific)
VTSTRCYGDNLDVLRKYVPGESVDFVYFDSPFDSNRTYNVLFEECSGEAAPAQIEAFNDTWTWDRAAGRQCDDPIVDGPTPRISASDVAPENAPEFPR